MTLQKQLVPLVFSGMDTKTDDKVLPAGRLKTLQNAEIVNAPTMRKRAGYEKLSGIAATAVFAFNDEILASADDTLYTYNDVANSWVSKGTAIFSDVSIDTLVGGSVTHTLQDYQESGNYGVIAWKTTDGLWYAVKDLTTGAFVLSPTLVAVTPLSIKVVVSSNTFWILYRVAATLCCICGPMANPDTATAVEHVSTYVGGVPDAIYAFGGCCIAYYDTNATFTILAIIREGNVLGVGTGAFPAPVTTTVKAANRLALATASVSGVDRLYVVGAGATTTIQVEGFDGYFNSIDANDATTVTSNIVRMAAVCDSAHVHVFVDFAGASKEACLTRIKSKTIAGTGYSSEFTLAKGSILATPYLDGDSVIVPILYDSDSGLQRNGFFFSCTPAAALASWSTVLIGRFLTNVAEARQTHVRSSNSGVLCAGKAVLKTSSSVIENTVVVTFSRDASPVMTDVLDTALFAGSFVGAYDGTRFSELGFLLFPEPPSCATTTSGGHMADGTYLYCAIYEWIDNNGRVHRSSPSTATSHAVSGGSGIAKVTVTLQCLWATLKTQTQNPIKIQVFRTEDAGTTIFYKVSEGSATSNSLSAATVTFVDEVPDSDLISKEILYTAGGIVENIPPPGCSTIARYLNRVAVSGGECSSRIFWTKPLERAAGFSFSDVLVTDLQLERPISALGTMDANLLVFTRKKCHALSGEPPDATASNNTLSVPQQLPADVGCVSPRSIVETPVGLMFQSEKGIWLLDRSLAHAYIGAEVEAYDDPCTGAAVESNKNQVLFTSATNTLAYDYFYKYWAVHTPAGVGSAMGSAHVIATSSGDVWRKDSSLFADDGANFTTMIETGWISTGMLQGMQRILNVLFFGKYVGRHTLVVELSYDYRGFPEDIFSLDTSVVVGSTFGTATPFGTGTFGGTEDGTYRFRLKPRVQRCSAFKIKIYDAFPSNDLLGSFELTGVTLEVGVDKSFFRGSSTRSLT